MVRDGMMIIVGYVLRSYLNRHSTLREILMKFKAVIWKEDDVWCGSVPELPGCHTWGNSYEHLLKMLEDAIKGWLEVANLNE